MIFSAPHLNPIFFSHESLFLGFSSTAWTAIGSIGVILTVIAALFGEKIKAKILKPKLKFDVVRRCLQEGFENSPGIYGMVIKLKKNYWVYRILVKNIGKTSAVNVRVLIEVVDEKQLILPIPLKWTHVNEFTRDISVGEPAFLDVLIEEDNKIQYFDSITKVVVRDEYSIPDSGNVTFKVSFYCDDRALESVYLGLDCDKRILSVSKRL